MRSHRSRIVGLSLTISLVASLAFAATSLAGGRPLSANLLGENERPVLGDPDGSGWFEATFNPGTGEVCYAFEVTGVDPLAAAHIHAAPAGAPAASSIPTPTDQRHGWQRLRDRRSRARPRRSSGTRPTTTSTSTTPRSWAAHCEASSRSRPTPVPRTLRGPRPRGRPLPRGLSMSGRRASAASLDGDDDRPRDRSRPRPGRRPARHGPGGVPRGGPRGRRPDGRLPRVDRAVRGLPERRAGVDRALRSRRPRPKTPEPLDVDPRRLLPPRRAERHALAAPGLPGLLRDDRVGAGDPRRDAHGGARPERDAVADVADRDGARGRRRRLAARGARAAGDVRRPASPTRRRRARSSPSPRRARRPASDAAARGHRPAGGRATAPRLRLGGGPLVDREGRA